MLLDTAYMACVSNPCPENNLPCGDELNLLNSTYFCGETTTALTSTSVLLENATTSVENLATLNEQTTLSAEATILSPELRKVIELSRIITFLEKTKLRRVERVCRIQRT